MHVDLGVLPADASVALLAEIAGPERIAAELPEARQLAEDCGHLPLALRIVGARLALRPGEPLGHVRDRLNRDRLKYLEYGDLQVRASFRLSYDALDPASQQAFRRLGLLRRRSFATWIVAEMLDTTLPRGEDLMENLLAARLVDIARVDIAGQTRYRLHDLLRLFAAELVSHDPAEEHRAAIGRVSRGFLTLALEADSALQPGGRQVADRSAGNERQPTAATTLSDIGVQDPLSWLTAERRSLVLAVERAAEVDLPEVAWNLAMTLHAFFDLRAHWTDWEWVAEIAERSAEAVQDPRLLAHAVRSLGDLRREQGRFDQADELLRSALTTFESEIDLLGKAITLRSLGNLCRQRFQWDKAYQYFANGYRLFKQLGDERGVALSQHDLGVALRNQGRWNKAIRNFERCLTVFRKFVDRRSEAYVLRNLAVAYRNQGRWTEATVHIEESLDIFDSIGDRRGWAYALAPLSDVYRETGHYDRALALLETCLLVRRELGDRRWVAATERSIGVVHRLLGQAEKDFRRIEKAEEMLQGCLREFLDLGDDRLAAYTRVGLGEVDGDLGRLDEALPWFAAALSVLTPLDDKLWQAKTRLSRGTVHLARGDKAAALADLRTACRIFTKLGAPEATAAAELLRHAAD
jgi:tetratricopeptide (TPR) repeat protein